MSNHPADDIPPISRPLGSSEVGLVQRTRSFIVDRFEAEQPRLLVGYSGGGDSLALLLVMRDLARVGACSLTAVHVDHRLRNEAEQDAGRAAAICRSLGVDVIVRRASDHPATLFPGVGIEEAARRVRFEAFRDVTGDVGANAVLLGHHARDQAETVLLHLMRGSGLHGLSGMAADTVLDVPWWSGGDRSSLRVLRPFLKENPDELRRVADRSGLPIVEDRSNDNPAFRRNRVRHELLPLMEDIAPGATGQLVSLAEIVREDESALDDVANRLLERAVTDGALDWETFWGAPFGLQRRVVRNWVFLLRGSGDLSLDRVDAVIALAERGQGGKSVEIVEGWSVEYRRRSLRLIAPPVR